MAKNKAQTAQHETNWQSTKLTVLDRLSYLLKNRILCDVHFIVGKEAKETFSAHKLILSMTSSVFYTMFNGPIPGSDEIVVPDIEPKAFKAVLRYIYNEVIDIDASTVLSILYTAKKYELPGLEEACENFLLKNVSYENVFRLLSQAKFFDLQRLVDHCLQVIDKDALRSFQNKDFADIDGDLLRTVFIRDSLTIEEKELFKAALRWAVAECKRKGLDPVPANQRVVLGDVFFLIRFPLMTAEDFANGPVMSGLLTDKEGLELLIHMNDKEKPMTLFPTKPRQLTDSKIRRFDKVASRRQCIGYTDHKVTDKVNFTSSREIILKGVGLYGASTKGPATFEGSVKIISDHNSNIKTADFTFTSFASSPSRPFVYIVSFHTPLKIMSKTEYSITTSMTGPDCFVGVNGSPKIAVKDHLGRDIEFEFTSSDTIYPPSRGLLAELVFFSPYHD